MNRELVVSVDAMGGDNAPQAIIDGSGDRPCAPSQGEVPAARRPCAPAAASCSAKPATQERRSGRCIATTPSRWTTSPARRCAAAGTPRCGAPSTPWQEAKPQVAVSAGNTGALMAMSMVQLRTIEGISRPAIAAIWPTMRGQTRRARCRRQCRQPTREQLVDFAVMGEAFARVVFGTRTPDRRPPQCRRRRDEGQRGGQARGRSSCATPACRCAFTASSKATTSRKGTVDVVVTDGFTGNIALKTAEGTARLVGHYLRSALTRSLFSRAGRAVRLARAATSAPARWIRARVNGGVFLGLNGVVVKSHGGTDGVGFASAIDLAIDMARQRHHCAHRRRDRAFAASITALGGPDAGSSRAPCWLRMPAPDACHSVSLPVSAPICRATSSPTTNSRSSVDTTDEWIRERTGIRERHIAADGEMHLRSRDRGLAGGAARCAA